MKIIGIVVEYNPFHNGHKHHLKNARTNKDDVVIAVMSGDFVQRGEPALIGKCARAKTALLEGVDIVIELPSFYSTQSAEIFSSSAVKILNYMKVDTIVFGSECGNIEILKELATNNESSEFKEALTKELKKGTSYPVSYSNTLKEFNINFEIKSNDILALEYIKAGMKINPKLDFKVVQRKNTEYNDLHVHEDFASATGIRKKLFDNENIQDLVTYNSYNILKSHKETFLNLSQLYPYIRYEILNNLDRLSEIQDVSEGLENRLYEFAYESRDFETFFKNLQTKRYSDGRLQRVLIHILLGITKKITEDVKNKIPYIRVLGFTNNGQKYLSSFEPNDDTPKIITTFKGIKKKLTDDELFYLELNEKNSMIYKIFQNYQDSKSPIIIKD